MSFKPVRILVAAAISCTGPPAIGTPSTGAAPLEAEWRAGDIVAFTNGMWYDGERFVPRSIVYIVDGRMNEVAPASPAQIVNLGGRYVIPPLADGHTHSFDGPFGFPAQRAQFLDEGVFYAMTMTAPSAGVARIRGQLRGPTNVDVASSMGGITGPHSHPAEIYEANALGYYSYRQQLDNAWEIRQSRRMADNAYFIVADRADVDAKWPVITNFAPDFLKVFLRRSDRYRPDRQYWDVNGGVDPLLLPYIVARGTAAGLRTAVAASVVADFRAALDAGAAIVTHLPCYQDSGGPGPYFFDDEAADCLLSDGDAAAAASIGLATILITSEWAKQERSAQRVGWEQRNISTLQEAHARIAVGSNAYGSTPVDGLIAGASRDLYPAGSILRWATQETARMIFPDRRIGCLDTGCEASFLVLDANPLEDMAALRAIALRVKDGEPLTPDEYRAS